MSYKIKIEIEAEDIQDVKIHLSQAREQIASAIKQNPDKPYSPIQGAGINSGHSITIEKQ